jgi:effector-binding domain-containing protein
MAGPHGAVGTQLNQGKFAAIRKFTSPGCVVYARFKGMENIGKKIEETRQWAMKKGYTIVGVPTCVCQADFAAAPDRSAIEVQWPIAEIVAEQNGEIGVKWHYSLEVLSTYHRGSYETIGQSYDFLMAVVREKHLGVPTGTRSVYLTEPSQTAGDANLTECQVMLQ